MGKNNKKNNVFKVAGAKSFKSKAKAKSVKTDLKNINNIKNKKQEVDKLLTELQDKVRKIDTVPEKSTVNKTKLKIKSKEDVEKEKKSIETLDSMNAMSVS
ncbi:unnamed protein product [Brassicogethes aeneus]|uniref:Uncharacterized protein n=1 Tax=Brassicogethes aeneus TaxID=1431903 RepID=A0A9P0B841_BRAAE|nr:unnamed protein product [Brassicogethes aeneus]